MSFFAANNVNYKSATTKSVNQMGKKKLVEKLKPKIRKIKIIMSSIDLNSW